MDTNRLILHAWIDDGKNPDREVATFAYMGIVGTSDGSPDSMAELHEKAQILADENAEDYDVFTVFSFGHICLN